MSFQTHFVKRVMLQTYPFRHKMSHSYTIFHRWWSWINYSIEFQFLLLNITEFSSSHLTSNYNDSYGEILLRFLSNGIGTFYHTFFTLYFLHYHEPDILMIISIMHEYIVLHAMKIKQQLDK